MTKSITLNYTIVALAAIAMVFAYTGVANAAVNSTKINIVTVNRGNIDNVTTADSHTGDNAALGSDGGEGGEGGEVNGGAGSENNGGASAGTGGAGGSGGLGGEIRTGGATSVSAAVNWLNTTILRVRM